MKKKKIIYNSKVYFLLTIMVAQCALPTVSYGLSGDASQPEFAAYEEFNTTDMVSLITGDFNYNIPLLNVPSPEGGFQMPLSYHAGIELDEESSWVGLGWSLNPGVVDRDVSMYPDDYKGESISSEVKDDGGVAYIRNFLMYTDYYDAEKGKGGTIALGDVHFGWGSKEQVGLSSVGLTYANGSIKYSVDDMAQSMGTHMNNAISIWGGPAGTFLTLAYTAIQVGVTINSAKNALNASHQGGWTTKDHTTSFLGIGKKTTINWYFDKTSSESQYGSLYIDGMGRGFQSTANAPETHVSNGTLKSPSNSNLINIYYTSSPSTNNSNIPSSDMFMNYENPAYASNIAPTGIAYDNFNVKSGGISGGIAPFRHDLGSLSNPVAMMDYHTTFNISNFGYPNGGKVEFRYNGDISNSYTHPVIGGDINNPSFAFSPFYIFMQNSILVNDAKAYDANDAGYNVNVKTEALRNGLYNNSLVHGRHIQWYSNSEISGNSAKAQGFMEAGAFFSRSALPQSGIGGFTITREDGLTYHYTIPVYNRNEHTRFERESTHIRVDNHSPYATMWLLTGITGSDFIDRGTIGLIDQEDWGYWVQFSYGKFASDYSWRTPYHAMAVRSADNSQSFRRGTKETYYLNKISTRTHTALFAKSYKSDGKSFHDTDGLDYGDGNNSNSNNARFVPLKPSSSLKLDDIYVLENSDYNTLTTSVGLNPNFNSGQGNSGLRNGDTYNNVLDNFDLSDPAVAAFLKANQINKYHFNYSYALCNKTWNSFDFNTDGSVPAYNSDSGVSVDLNLRKGKLTLMSVEFLSVQNARIMPGYVFGYGNTNSSVENPNYDPNKWDDWNMYNSNGVSSTQGHEPTFGGDQWSLKKIITPLGSEIEVNYERDTYGSVNGLDLPSDLGFHVDITTNQIQLNSINGLSVGSVLPVFLQIQDCQANSSYPNPVYPQILNTRNQVKQVTVSAISGNVITTVENLKNLFNITPLTAGNFPINFSKIIRTERYGGGLRVKNLKVKDENGNSYMTKYTYTKNGSEAWFSSGVCTYEPEHANGIDYAFYKLQDHPVTPILYSNVTVTNGRFEGVFQETNKTVYHFVTPHLNMISYNRQIVSNAQYHTEHRQCCVPFNNHDFYSYYSHLSANFNILNKTAQIGNLDTVKSYNTKNHLINKVVYEYSDNASNDYPLNMGKYAETTFLYEYLRTGHTEDDPNNPKLTQDWYLYRLLQTNRVKFPNILKSVSTTQNGITSRQEFKEYDYLTGAPVRVLTTYGNQEKYESYTVPAYTKNAEMSSKVYDPKNKNMMTASAEQYSYVYDQGNNKKLLDASITVWSKVQNYRSYNGTTSAYENVSPGTAANMPYQDGNVYLPFRTYQWKSIVDEDGTIKNSDYVAYNWSLPNQNKHWIKTSEATLYDRYSRLLESKDINGKLSSVKYGYGSAFEIGGQANSSYNGWCYSGAEDKSADPNYFDGEVSGSSTQFLSPTFAHTGKYSSRCYSNQAGFVFKGAYGKDFNYATYRSSVWVHASNVQDAVLYGVIKNSSGAAITTVQTTLGDPGVTQVGSWYLFKLDLKINAGVTDATTVEFGCKNTPSPTTTGGAVYFDDFRVHNISTPLTSNVYDPKTALVTATLDEENFATKFIYDNAGRIITTYKETKQGLKLVSKSEYNYAR